MKKAWWKEAVVYQIYPKSFQDSNGDGIGDLQGIIRRLDYIQELGVNVIWLCPVYKSPMQDNGYDIADYYHIDPMFGTDRDMDELIEQANKRGIKILMDLVVNHTSDQHEWFQEARKDPKGKYADYYIIKEGINQKEPNNWRTYFGGSAWERIEDSNLFYLHTFDKKQPDLNWENKALREEIYKMVNYWLDKGLGGFRIDAICNIKKNIEYGRFPADGEDGLCYIGKWILNQPGIEEFLDELNERTFKPHDSMTVAEANIPEHLLEDFIGEDGFFKMVFDFSYTDIDVPESGEWFRPTGWTIGEMKAHIFNSQKMLGKTGWGAPYLENHDQPRSINKYVPCEERNYYSKTMLGCLFMMLRGTPFIYQGQEIGMENIRMNTIDDYDDIATHNQYNRAIAAGYSVEEALEVVYKRSRDHSRTPMQWDTTLHAGFSQAPQTWIKVNQNYKEIHAEENRVLDFYKKLVALRRTGEFREVTVYGTFEPIEDTSEYVIAYQRKLGTKSLTVICNFQSCNSSIVLKEGCKKLVVSNYETNVKEGDVVQLRPYECIIFA